MMKPRSVFDYQIFLSHAAADESRADEVRAYLISHGYSVYCDRYDDPNLDRGRVNRETADVLRERMRTCQMLLFVVSANSAQSKWMPWELGFFDAARGAIVVYPVDEEAARAAKGQEYLSLYEIVEPGSIERQIAAKLNLLPDPLVKADIYDAINILGRNLKDNMFAGADAKATDVYAERIARMNPGQLFNLQSDIMQAWWRLWFGIVAGRD